jgi:hypothetical protein
MRFFAIVSFAVLAVAATHVYFWLRLVRSPRLRRPWSTVATVAIAVLGATIPANFVLMRVLTPGRTTFVQLPIYVWMGAMLLLVGVLVGLEPIRLAFEAVARRRARDEARRSLVSRLLGGAAVAGVAVATAHGMATALGPVAVRDVRVEVERLPRELSGTTIVQITDLHLGPTLGRRWLERVVDRVNALEPDVVAITGDLVDGPVSQMRDIVAPVAALRARRGVYFVTGNHEYYWGAESWVEHLPSLGVRVLRNERVTIGEGEASFELAGVDDFRARGMAPGHGADLSRALAGRDTTRPVVLLAHQPRAIGESARAGVALQLSGHTHGGQLWPWMYLVRLQQPTIAGLERFAGTWIYTSQGTGFWGPPIRLGTRPEIARVVLVAPRP